MADSPNPSSSNDQTSHSNSNSSSPQTSQPSKRTRGRPAGSKNKPKFPLRANEPNDDPSKPILIQVPMDCDVIEAVIQFARRYQVSITVLSASGYISQASLRHPESLTSSNYHGPFTLISLSGTYNPFVTPSSSSSSSTDLNIGCFFKISFSSSARQSFMGIVGGKVIAANEVTVVATTFRNFEIPRIIINDGSQEANNNNIN